MQKSETNRLVRLNILIFLLIALLGCAPTIKIGKLPNTEALNSLMPKTSTKEDVQRVLGKPAGYGKTQHSPDELTMRDIWLYRYVEAKGSKSNVKLLIVFIEGEQYDGYLWVSSVTEFKN